MDDVKFDLRNVAVKNGETERLTEQNGHFREGSQGQLKGCRATEDEG